MKKRTNPTLSRIRNLALIFAVILSFSSCKKKKTENSPFFNLDYKQAILDSRNDLRTYLLTSSTPGLSITVSIDGKRVWSEGVGYANKELSAPANRNTKYRIGSASQLFTSFLIAKMQEEGKLNIDSSFYHYIPNFPKKQADFTIRMLMSQVAGFPESSKSEPLELDKNVRTLKDYIKTQENDSLVYQPNTYFFKSNYSVSLLGILAEEVAEKKYSKLIYDEILDTLHLENTFIDDTRSVIKNRSSYYFRDYIARLINAPEVNLRPLAPALGFLSTSEDLNTAAQQILEPGFFKQESIDLFRTPYKLSTGQQLNSGFGWLAAVDHEGRKLVGQVGNTIGGGSSIAIYPDQKLVVTMCANLGDELDELPVLRIADHFLAKIDPREPEKQNPKK